tara:strand:- start:18888 stop:20063 length:1176 start_codon:yes stop_codon:yes gene_type:complete
MIKNIYFIHRFHFNKSYYENDDFQELKNNGYRVKYIDIVGLLKSSKLEDTCPEDLKKDVIYINTKKEFKQFLSDNKHNSVLATCVGLQINSAWFYRIISQSKIPYIFLDVNFFPQLKSSNRIKNVSTKVKRLFEKTAPNYLFLKGIRSIDYYYTKFILRPSVAILYVKSSIRKRVLKLANKDTKLIKTNSNDWNTANKNVLKIVDSDNYLVFIDQYVPYHPDFVARNIDLKFTAEEYYNEINSNLENVSKGTGLEVIIAAHPRRMGANDYNFPLFYNETSNLIKHSKLVLAHYSTAVNFAAIHNIPLQFLTSNLLQRSYIGRNIEDMAFTFNKKPINLSSEQFNNENFQNLLNIDNLAYSEYIEKNLAPSDSSQTGEIIIEVIELLDFREN